MRTSCSSRINPTLINCCINSAQTERHHCCIFRQQMKVKSWSHTTSSKHTRGTTTSKSSTQQCKQAYLLFVQSNAVVQRHIVLLIQATNEGKRRTITTIYCSTQHVYIQCVHGCGIISSHRIEYNQQATSKSSTLQHTNADLLSACIIGVNATSFHPSKQAIHTGGDRTLNAIVVYFANK